jgi:iron complex outermembrane receptor protein
MMDIRISYLSRSMVSVLVFLGVFFGVADVHAYGVGQEDSGAAKDEDAKTLDKVTVTGSRIKRAEIEGALPVFVMDRQQIEASGDISVADLLRDSNFNSFGSYQTTSGSSWGGFTGISLGGLGESRTLILIDGRRAPTAPMTGSSQDLNTIPLAAVERIEILPDGASALYGSDALGGVVNIITRKDYEGMEVTYGMGKPRAAGGDTTEGSILYGAFTDRGRVLAGANYSKRDELYTRDRDFWMETPGTSTYSNNLYTLSSSGSYSAVRHPTYGSAVPGSDCITGENLFYTTGTGSSTRCQYNHSQISAKNTSVENIAVFANAEFDINVDWKVFFNSIVSRVETFGRYAPVPSSPWPGDYIVLEADSPNNPGNPDGYNAAYASDYDADTTYYLRHRFAALGPRDGTVKNTLYDFTLGFEGKLGPLDLQFGTRYTESEATDTGENYVVAGLAQEAIDSGDYNIYDPYGVDDDVLNSFTATILRDMKTVSKEVFGNTQFELFNLPGGTVSAVVGGEYREDTYQDKYDPLSEAGQIVGSAGNSSAGDRDLTSAYMEILLPFFNGFEVDIAGRYDKYSDYGSELTPKISLRWHPLENWTFRASYGEGFRAPSLDILNQKSSFSAVSVSHPATCEAFGLSVGCSTQVNTYSIANPDLESEQSESISLGVVWDVTAWLNLSLDYRTTEITNQISSIGAGTIIECLEGSGSLCPSGLSVFPEGTVIPNESLGLGVTYNSDGSIANVQTGYTNMGTIETEIFDFTANTRFDLGGLGYLRNRLSTSYYAKYSSNGGASIIGRPGYPRIRGKLSTNWVFGDLSVNWNISYTHGTQSQAYRALLGDEGTDYGLSHHLSSYTIHDLQLTYNTPWNATITLGVQNLFDREAVIDPYYEDFDADLYDTWGRTPYFRYTQKF